MHMKLFKSEEKKFIEIVVKRLVERGHENIKASLGNYKTPAKVVKKSTDTVFIPEITSNKDQVFWLYSIVTPKNLKEKNLIAKWKLFYEYSIQSGSRFYIVFRKGMLKDVQKLMDDNHINAELWDFDKKEV